MEEVQDHKLRGKLFRNHEAASLRDAYMTGFLKLEPRWAFLRLWFLTENGDVTKPDLSMFCAELELRPWLGKASVTQAYLHAQKVAVRNRVLTGVLQFDGQKYNLDVINDAKHLRLEAEKASANQARRNNHGRATGNLLRKGGGYRKLPGHG